jgi:N-methylhydantoinase B
LARNAITAMPDGQYRFTDWMDDDGIDPDPIPITVTITVKGTA